MLRLAERPQGTRKRWRGSRRRNEGRGTRGRKRSRKWRVKRGRSEVEVAVAVAVNAVEVAEKIAKSRRKFKCVVWGGLLESCSYNSGSIYTTVALSCMRDLETMRKSRMSEEHRGNTAKVRKAAQSSEECGRKRLQRHNKEVQMLRRGTA